MTFPQVVVLFSGKRKSGKDFITEKLCSLFGEDISTVIRISEPIKSQYAKENKLDLQELMSDSEYKEMFRKKMIEWSDAVRKEEPGFFCKLACESAKPKKIWIVSDIRRKTDIAWFLANYGNKIKTIRIYAELFVRTERGWKFTPGVDDVTSECDLDDYANWDLEIENSHSEKVDDLLLQLQEFIQGQCH